MTDKTYTLGIDIGGTFTDLVLLCSSGTVTTWKSPTTPHDYSEGVATAVESFLAAGSIRAAQVVEVVHATTVATNAVLENKGAKVGLVTTAGFRDIVEIRRLRIPVLYKIFYDKPEPLIPRNLRFEVRERIAASGDIRTALDEDDVRRVGEELRKASVDAVAVSFLHAYINDAHERRAVAILGEMLGDDCYITCGSQLLPESREYERTSTVCVNAYVGPLLKSYAARLLQRLRALGVNCPVQMMHSSGGTTDIEFAVARAASLVESGPAAGVVACAKISTNAAEMANFITFDMGGTTTKAALIENGDPARTTEYEIGAGISLSSRLIKGGGHPIRFPFIDVSEIGAGGGSLVAFDGLGRLTVGPHSAGSSPGPICYGRGGTQLTLTDAFLCLGYLNPVALASGAIEIDAASAHKAMKERVADVLGVDVHKAASGVLAVAATTMTRAVKAVTTYRGRDPREFTMVAFGGNGPVVAATVAEALGIRKVVVPPTAGVFSALGLAVADTEEEVVIPLKSGEDAFDFGDVRNRLRAALARQADWVDAESIARDGRFFLDMRYAGQGYELTTPLVDADDLNALRSRFNEEHRRTYGHMSDRDAVEIVSARLRVRRARNATRLSFRQESAAPARARNVYFDRFGEIATPIITRGNLGASDRRGPLVIEDYDTTIVVPPSASARLDEDFNVQVNLGQSA
ncbi:MAG: hydantoinase/oxoprolinase family protein [Rhizobiaceae bacterium]|nr:hydantoinase/oxoprolinase family protein [Rhizobiaceae bacterium]